MSSINRKRNVDPDRAPLLVKAIDRLEKGAATLRGSSKLDASRRVLIAAIRRGSGRRKPIPAASAPQHKNRDILRSTQKSGSPAVERWENEGGAIR